MLEILLFNFQRPKRRRLVSSPESLSIISHPSPFVKCFSKLFSSFQHPRPRFPSGISPLSQAAFVVYHHFSLLSRGFFKFFHLFSRLFPLKRKKPMRIARPLTPNAAASEKCRTLSDAEPARFLPRRPLTPEARAARHTVFFLALCRNPPSANRAKGPPVSRI